MADGRRRQLNKVLDQLTSENVALLAEFADFLRARQPEPESDFGEACVLPRPQDESVIAAIRRLSKSYPMLAKDDLFNEASSLMTRHLMHGESAEATIDRLESIFKARYDLWISKRDL